jgi:hypothetical protein
MVAYASCADLYRLEAYATLKSGRHQRKGGNPLLARGTVINPLFHGQINLFRR